MSIKTISKQFIENLTGKKFYSKLPHGIDAVEDILYKFPSFNFSIVFDVGANVGEKSVSFSKNFPESKIYCFEPSPDTFAILENNTRNYSNIKIYNLGLSLQAGTMYISDNEFSDRNTIIKEKTGKVIKMQTLSDLCSKESISHINFLKVDTEGFDLQVIQSAESMLEKQSIDFIEAEVGMNPTNTLHVPLHHVQSYLESKDYFLFGLYEQVHEWGTNYKILRRCNALFVSKKLGLG